MFPIPTPKLINPNPALPSNQTYIQIWMDPFLTHHLLPPHPHQIHSKEPGQKALSLLQHSELQNHPLISALASHPFSAPPSLCHCLHWLASKFRTSFWLAPLNLRIPPSSAISLFSSLPLLVSSLSPLHYTLLSIFSWVPPITLSFSGIDPPMLLHQSHLDIPSCDYTIHFFAFPHWPKEGTCLFSRAYGSQSSLMPVIYLHRVVLPPMTCCHCSHSFHPLIILCSF